jgi:hypothetical protein
MTSILRITLCGLMACFGLGAQQDIPAPQKPARPQPPATEKGAQAKAPQKSAVSPTVSRGMSGVVAPGSVVTILISGGKSFSVNAHKVNEPDKTFAPLAGTATSDSLSVRLPAEMDPGAYYFTLADDADSVIPGSVDVEPERIKLSAVYPATAFRADTRKFNFDIVGENFSINPVNDDVTFEGQGSIVENRGKNKAACNEKNSCLWVENERLMHIVGYSPIHHQGVVNVGVRVGNVTATDQKPLVLAKLSGTVVFILSTAVTGVLFWIVSFIVASGLAKNKVGRRSLNLLQSFIFDPETNSYSLSKFQLLVFSATFIFGYVYVLLSRWLVQWQFSLPDVPSTIAGLLGISGGTTIASTGLTASRGPKGAGLQQPTGADLISTGGVVVPERFQFFVWTIVACGSFVALLIGQDPAKVSNFPELPAGLLYVMGISAAGYLGGKSARKPGPVLENLGVTKPTGKILWATIIVQGQNLASDGRFFIDEKELGFVSDEDKAKFKDLPPRLIKPTPQPGASDINFCAQLEIIIANSAIDVTQGDHTFRIVNRDGQFADLSFTADSPAIAAVYQNDTPQPLDNSGTKTLPASDQAVTVVIKGSGLILGSQVDWRPPGAINFETQSPVPGSPADGTELWVSLVPGLRVDTPGNISVTTPQGFVAIATVQVVKGSVSSTAQAPQTVSQQAAAPQAQSAGEGGGASAPAKGAEGNVAPGEKAPAEGPHPDKALTQHSCHQGQ